MDKREAWGADGWHVAAERLGVSKSDPRNWKHVEKGSRAHAARQGRLFSMLEDRLAWGPLEAIRQVLPLLDQEWGWFHRRMADAFRIASGKNRLDALPHLLGLDPDLDADDPPPLSYAMRDGNVEFARILLEHGARFENALGGEPFHLMVHKDARDAFRDLEREFAGTVPETPRRLTDPHYIELYGVSMATEALDDLTVEAGAKTPFSSFCTDADHDLRDKLRSPRTVLPMVRSYIRYLEEHADEYRDGLRADRGRGTVDLETILGDLRMIEEDAALALEQEVKVVLAITR